MLWGGKREGVFFCGFWYLEQRCEGRTGRVLTPELRKGDGGGIFLAVMAVVSLGLY